MTMLPRIRLVAMVLLFCAISAQASAANTPAAATQPARPQSADERAIREILKGLAKALQEGDAKQVKAVISASDEAERKMVDSMAGMAVEISKLHKASAKAFGEKDARELTGDVSSELSRIDQAEVAVSGDSATVRYPQEESANDEIEPAASPPLTLKKLDGAWRVPMSELSKESTPEEIEQTLKDLAAQTKVVTEVTEEIASGKYKTAEKAAEAWQAKMMQVLLPRKSSEEKKNGGPATKSSNSAKAK